MSPIVRSFSECATDSQHGKRTQAPSGGIALSSARKAFDGECWQASLGDFRNFLRSEECLEVASRVARVPKPEMMLEVPEVFTPNHHS